MVFCWTRMLSTIKMVLILKCWGNVSPTSVATKCLRSIIPYIFIKFVNQNLVKSMALFGWLIVYESIHQTPEWCPSHTRGEFCLASAVFAPFSSWLHCSLLPLLQWYGHTLLIIIILAIWVRVRVTGDTHITRVLGMGTPISLWHPDTQANRGDDI